jgi:hypothetical protein
MNWRPKWWLTFLARVWPITRMSAKATQIPFIGKLFAASVIPLFSGRNFNVTYIPVNEELKGPENIHLPLMVLEELIRRSAHRVTIKRCHCRESNGCKEFPIENACLHLGQGTAEHAPWIADSLSVDDAIAHARHMVGLGLTPMIGRVRMDNILYGVPDRGKLLTVCFCCHCCCTVMSSAKYFPKKAMDSIVRLEGVKIAVDSEKCRVCRSWDCIEGCMIRAYTFEGGIVRHDAGRCKGCGWCVSLCPHKAIRVEVADIGAAVDELLGRIDGLVNYSS